MGVRLGGGAVKHAWSGADEDALRAEWAATDHHGRSFNERLGKLLGRTAEGVRRKTIEMHLRPKRVVSWADPGSLRREREPVATVPKRCPRCANVLVALADPVGGRRVACLLGCYDVWV